MGNEVENMPLGLAVIAAGFAIYYFFTGDSSGARFCLIVAAVFGIFGIKKLITQLAFRDEGGGK